jgi:hypothetical protein
VASTITHNTRQTGRLRTRFEFDAAGGTTPWLPVRDCEVSVVVKPTAGTMRAEYTWSPEELVMADNANASSLAVAKAWPAGDVNAATVDAEVKRISAVRFVATNAGIAEVAC